MARPNTNDIDYSVIFLRAFKSTLHGEGVELTLPLPPSLNALYEPNRYGGIKKSELGKAYQRNCRDALQAELYNKCGIEYGRTLYSPDTWLKIEYDAIFAGKRYDLDNINKLPFDTMEKVIYHNDNHIIEAGRMRVYVAGRGVTSSQIRISLSVISRGDYPFIWNEDD